MRSRLVTARWRGVVLVAVVGGAAVVLGIGAVVFHGTTTGVDTWAFRMLYAHLGPSWAAVTLGASDPAISILLLAGTATVAGIRRCYDVPALCLLGPLSGVLLTQFVLKRLVGRTLHAHAIVSTTANAVPSAYPSGHETLVACAAITMFVAVCRAPSTRRARAAAGVVLGLWMLTAAIGLVRNFWHYATDTIGAVGLSVAVVLAAALLIDCGSDALRRRSARGRARASRTQLILRS